MASPKTKGIGQLGSAFPQEKQEKEGRRGEGQRRKKKARCPLCLHTVSELLFFGLSSHVTSRLALGNWY